MLTEKQEKERIKEITSILKKNPDGLNISQITKKTKISKSFIRTAMYMLKGANKVKMIQVGMSKLYKLKNERGKDATEE